MMKGIRIRCLQIILIRKKLKIGFLGAGSSLAGIKGNSIEGSIQSDHIQDSWLRPKSHDRPHCSILRLELELRKAPFRGQV